MVSLKEAPSVEFSVSAPSYHQLSEKPLLPLLRELEKERASAVIQVDSPSGRGEISIKSGRLLGAAFGASSGADALLRVLEVRQGRYQLHHIPRESLLPGASFGKTLHAGSGVAEEVQTVLSLPILSEILSKADDSGAKNRSSHPPVKLGMRQVLATSSSNPPAQKRSTPLPQRLAGPIRSLGSSSKSPSESLQLNERRREASSIPPARRVAALTESSVPPGKKGEHSAVDTELAARGGEANSSGTKETEASRDRTADGAGDSSPSSGAWAPVMPKTTSVTSPSNPPLVEGAPAASAPIDTKSSFLTTSISGTAPRFLPSAPTSLPRGPEQEPASEEPVPSRRFARETLDELEELHEAIRSTGKLSGLAVPDVSVQQGGRPPGFSSTMKSNPEDELLRVGRYEVLARLKSGGMGSVYLCRASGNAGFRRLFAMKVLGKGLTDPAAQEAFFREAEVLSKLHHPNIVGIVDVGTPSQPYIVLDYVEGGSLHELLVATPGQRDPKLVVSVVLDALAGIDAAHRATDDHGNPLGLVHCDLTPHNLLVGVDGACRVADFGIATQQHRAESVMRGKPGYVAPERLAGQTGDQRSDIFSLGVVLYSALTGVEPFKGESIEATLQNVLKKPIPSPSEVGLCPPPSLDWVCMKALARDPSERFQSAEEMMVHLRKVVAREELLTSPSQVARWVTRALEPVLEARRRAAQRGGDDSSNHQVSAAEEAPAPEPFAVNVPGASSAPPSFATNEKTEYIPGLDELDAEGGGPVSLIPRSIAGLPKKRRIGVYVALVGIVAVCLVVILFPDRLGTVVGNGDLPDDQYQKVRIDQSRVQQSGIGLESKAEQSKQLGVEPPGLQPASNASDAPDGEGQPEPTDDVSDEKSQEQQATTRIRHERIVLPEIKPAD